MACIKKLPSIKNEHWDYLHTRNKKDTDVVIIDKKRVKTSHTHVSRVVCCGFINSFFGLANLLWSVPYIHDMWQYQALHDAITFVDRKINSVTER